VLDAPASNTKLFLSRETCVSSVQLNSPVWKKRAYLHYEKPKLQEVFLSKTYSILSATMCYIVHLLTQMGFFGGIQVFLQLRRIGLFEIKRTYLHIEKTTLQEIFFSKTYSTLTGKQCDRCSCF
jgi:hypothetical protein